MYVVPPPQSSDLSSSGGKMADQRIYQTWKGSNVLQGVSIYLDEEDEMVWWLEDDGKFSVRSWYKALIGVNSSIQPIAKVWEIDAPLKQTAFLWLATWHAKERC